MCNDYRLEVDIASIMEDFDDLQIKIATPEGTPNVQPRADIQITDMAPIVRSLETARGAGELVNRRWSWPNPNGSPLFNFRTEEREFRSKRCLILTDGFYEFTKAKDPRQKRKDKWLFTLNSHRWFCIAGIWRSHPEVGEAFTMLTIEPGEDIAPYHSRQIVPLRRDQWADWLDPSIPAEELLKPLPGGSLTVTPILPPAPGPDQAALAL